MKDWNDEFGDWQGLACAEQVPRYQHIAGLLKKFSGQRVLDVGCGETVLRNFLPPSLSYLGIEPSAKAVNGRKDIAYTTAEDFAAGASRWDCIVFNEVLYYSRDPIYLLRKYAQFLLPNGKIIISIYQKPDALSLKARLLHYLEPRRPMSNLQCTQMVVDFISCQRWAIETDDLVAGRWRIWTTLPI
jgi:2-polyprenyl-3-methyl-5-hydroxy-6-metoxy-1,4-benzoquinol methylase